MDLQLILGFLKTSHVRDTHYSFNWSANMISSDSLWSHFVQLFVFLFAGHAETDFLRWLSSADIFCLSHLTSTHSLVRIRHKNSLVSLGHLQHSVWFKQLNASAEFRAKKHHGFKISLISYIGQITYIVLQKFKTLHEQEERSESVGLHHAAHFQPYCDF